MAEFNFPEWRLGVEPPADDLPPPEHAEADAVREQQLNDQYLAGQRQILNQGEGAYYRQQGETAIHAAPPALEALQQLKDDTLAQAGNDRQRGALTKRLDWHHGEAARGISRHLAGQADAWRQAVADNQIKTAEEEAAVNHNDPAKVELFAAGAYSLRLRSAGQPPDSEAVQASAAQARSSVYRRAIEAALASGDTRSAIGLYERAKDQLTASDAGPMQGQIKAVTQRETAQVYLAGLPKAESSQRSAFFDAPKQLADADAAHRAATAQNDADWAHDPDQRAINQHYIDVQFGQQTQAIADAKAKLNNAVSTWIATPRPDGQPQTDLPPPALWIQLGPDEQQNVLAALKRNTTGEPPPDQPRSFGIDAEPSMKAARALRGEGDDENATSAGRQGAVHASEPPPDSPEYRAADAEARQLDTPSWEELGFFQKIGVAFERFNQESKQRDAALSADSAGRHWQQVQELQRRKDAGETLNVTEERYLLRNRRAASDLAQAVGRLVEAQRNIDRLPTSSALRQLLGASTAAEAARVLRERPGEIAQALGVESLPALTLSLVTLGVLGPVGGGLALTGSSGLEGYANGLIGALTKAGVDVSRPDELVRALQDKDLMDRVRGEATTDGAIEAGITAVFMVIGGRYSKGHHWVPTPQRDLPDLSTEARRVFNGHTSGWYGEPHPWSKEHALYNRGIAELWNKSGYNPSKMTAKDAYDFIDQIMQSRDPRIATFRDMIIDKRKQYVRFYEAWLRGGNSE